MSRSIFPEDVLSDLSAAFLATAATAVQLLRAPEVAAGWRRPSALAEPVSDEPVVDVLSHYERSQWIGTSVDDEFNVRVRRIGEELAGEPSTGLPDGQVSGSG